MTPAEIHTAADVFHEDSKTRARLHAFADLAEAAKARCDPTDRSFQKFLADEERLRSALARVEALPPSPQFTDGHGNDISHLVDP